MTAVYYNGDILTMAGDAPEYAEAVAVRDGHIAFVGSKVGALATAGDAELVDLEGRTLLPGFIDGWGHFTLLAQQSLGVNVAYFSESPPRTKAEFLNTVRKATPFNGWIIGYGYSETSLSDGALTLTDLDTAFPDTPVLISALSTLTGMVNSAGIRALGLTPQTPVNQPGDIVKDPTTGTLTGAMTFTPFLAAAAAAVGTYSQDVLFETYRTAEAILAAQGYTTVQTYQLVPQQARDLTAAFDRGVIAVDVIGLPVADANAGEMITNPEWTWGAYSHGDRGLKVAGYQVATDAAPQLRLASFTEPYLDTTGFPDGWKGFLTPRIDVHRWVRFAYDNDIQLFAYSNGDGGIDLPLEAIASAVEATGKTGDRRTIISHSYFVREDQLQRYAEYHIGAAMFPMHLTVYGDALINILGPDRANRESPLASAHNAGIPITLHSDCPSASPSVMETIWSAVTRQTMSGRVLGPEERVNPYLALLGVTRNVAYIYNEEATKGTITAGKIADLVILDRNPLKVAPDEIRDITVVETIKRGKAIHRSD